MKNPNYFILLIVSILFFGCAGTDSVNATSTAKSHKVIFKAIATSGVTLNDIFYVVNEDQVGLDDQNVNTFTSPEITSNISTIVKGEQNFTYFSIHANDPSTANESVTLQIFVDGILKKEGKLAGNSISGNISYSFY